MSPTPLYSSLRSIRPSPERVGCLPDEIANSIPAVDGPFCSAPCAGDNMWCPPEVPTGVTATPKCMVKDPVGQGMHCALSCKADADCGANGVCSQSYGPANGMCIYPPTKPAGTIQLVYGTTCPTGWKELTDLKGQLLAVAPGAGGATNGQPPLGVNETGRVGPHAHDATATVTDPGHNHAATITDPGHTHTATVTDPGHAHAVTDPGHAHAITDPGHAHPFASAPSADPTPYNPNPAGYATGDPQAFGVMPSPTGVTINAGPTAVTINAGATAVTVANDAQPGGVTVANAAGPTGVTAAIAVAPTTGAYYPLAYVIACVRA